jgi:hypothetical protein
MTEQTPEFREFLKIVEKTSTNEKDIQRNFVQRDKMIAEKKITSRV